MELTLKAANGKYLTAEDGGGTFVSANRDQAGEWEIWTFVDQGFGLFALRSSGGFYLGVEPSTGELTIDRTVIGEWEEWAAVPGETDGSVALQNGYTELFLRAIDGGDGGLIVDRDNSEIHAHESFIPSKDLLSTDQPGLPTPGEPQGPRIVGPLRTENKLWRDDTGLILTFFCSWFTAMRTLADNPPEFYRQLDIIAERYMGFRTFLSVGGWTPFWDGDEVTLSPFAKGIFDRNNGGHLRPAGYAHNYGGLPNYRDHLRTMLKACRSRGLKLFITTGDNHIVFANDTKELQFHEEVARICAEEGGLEVIALVEGTNEYPINRRGGDSEESRRQLGRILEVWRRHIPGVLTTMGACLSEEPDKLQQSCEYGNICSVHITRDPFETCIKRTFGVTNWEGDWQHLEDAIMEGEPAGPGNDSYQEQNDPANLTALYSMHFLLGHASTFFSGPSVKGNVPLESVWGFKELPDLIHAVLPKNVAALSRKANVPEKAIMYRYDKDSKAFYTSTYKTWNTTPPFPVKSWKLYTGTAVREGEGTPPNGVTGLLIGQFK